MVVTLANIMLRQAEKTANARQYVDDLITSTFSTIGAQGGMIIGTSVNGKTMTLQALPGMTQAHYVAAAELALSSLEAGLTRVPRTSYAISR